MLSTSLTTAAVSPIAVASDFRIKEKYKDCIISKVLAGDETVQSAKPICEEPLLDFCISLYTTRNDLNSYCKIEIEESIFWNKTYANAVECDSGYCTLIQQ